MGLYGNDLFDYMKIDNTVIQEIGFMKIIRSISDGVDHANEFIQCFQKVKKFIVDNCQKHYKETSNNKITKKDIEDNLEFSKLEYEGNPKKNVYNYNITVNINKDFRKTHDNIDDISKTEITVNSNSGEVKVNVEFK